MRSLETDHILPTREKELLVRCKQAVAAIDPTAQVILYGSRARGEQHPDSDYDLLIITNGPATLTVEDQYRRQLYPIELETGAVLTVILTRRSDWNSTLFSAMPLYQNIRREGIQL
ncbi:MAG: nucleotidyltransferase domain-containing protein [Desulfovermiculus sp.]|nr:nucleotidyltransferase domain-containing protein [Desulfovermiculus sp.]